MPRPLRRRRIRFSPEVDYFKPAGVRMVDLEEVNLTRAELEAIRLKDIEELEQIKAAKKMNVSQPTFNRILSSARKKVAKALVEGQAIRIKGGAYEMVRPRGGRFKAPARGGRGRMRGPAAGGPGGFCKCLKCGYKIKHTVGTPCNQIPCPKCKTKMTRA
ncbi:DUF134 domain-containing protein [Candidatus Woesearchaeota archaeon]|nr:DUF134 domain-containing protein [Candidatus Woesearchaeota archaeon]